MKHSMAGEDSLLRLRFPSLISELLIVIVPIENYEGCSFNMTVKVRCSQMLILGESKIEIMVAAVAIVAVVVAAVAVLT